MKNKKTEESGRDTMAAIANKPSVFVVRTSKDKEDELLKNLNEARMTKQFVAECKEISKKLRKSRATPETMSVMWLAFQ